MTYYTILTDAEAITLETGLRLCQSSFPVSGSLHESRTQIKERIVTVPKDVLEVLRFHHRRQDNEKEFCGSAYEDSGLVFCQPNGRRISPRNFVRHFDLLLKRAGIRHIAYHGTRHTHAAELLAAGVDMKTLQERFGHADIRTTGNIYGHVGEALQKDAAEKANEILNRRKKKTVATSDTRNTSRKHKIG